MTKSNIPLWVPDWREESNYPSLDSDLNRLEGLQAVEINQLAWEFLRRNPTYQSDYNKYFSPKYGVDDEFEEDIEKGTIPMFPCLVCYPDSLPEETQPQYIKRMHGKKWEIFPRYSYFEYKYQISLYPVDPKIDNPFISFVTGSSPSILASYGSNDFEHFSPWKLEKTSDAFVKFDLNLPIKPQIERAKELLQLKQKSLKDKGVINPYNSKIDTNLLSLYLRVLDADLHGIRPPEMARVLLPYKGNSYPDYSGTDSIKKSFKRAVHLRDEGYKYFSLKDDWSKRIK